MQGMLDEKDPNLRLISLTIIWIWVDVHQTNCENPLTCALYNSVYRFVRNRPFTYFKEEPGSSDIIPAETDEKST